VQLLLHPKFETNPINFTLHSRMSSYDSHITHSGKPVQSDTTLERHQTSVLIILLDPNIASGLLYQHSTGKHYLTFPEPFLSTFSSEEGTVYAKSLGLCTAIC